MDYIKIPANVVKVLKLESASIVCFDIAGKKEDREKVF